MKLRKKLRVPIITLISFGLFYFVDELFFNSIRNWFYNITGSLGVGHIISYVIVGTPIYLGASFVARNEGIWTKLGLNRSLILGFLFAAVCVIPMFLGFSYLFPFYSDIGIDAILIKVIAAGFFEELFFRAFLFGMLYRYTNLGFIPSILLGALFFGFVHMYQSTEFIELLGIFGVTFIGAIIFAWAYTEWQFNIWVPIFLHMLMNLAWDLFNVSETALGDTYANVFRLITIILIFLITIVYKKKRGEKFEINSETIWIKKQKGSDEI